MIHKTTSSIEIVAPQVAVVQAQLRGPASLVLETPSLAVRLRTGSAPICDSRSLPAPQRTI